ncbi:Serine/threonine-protein kinase ssp1 [Naviculisporaceae sp. PSN 640]
MEPQPPNSQSNYRPAHPHLHQIHPPPLSHIPPRTSNSTPVSSPGLFSPTHPRSTMSLPAHQTHSESATPLGSGGTMNSPYLHPLQSHKVRETHKANVEHDYTTGRKLINHYEIIEELGRGMHGKVKLARNLENGDNVAIKIIPRFSKKRRLGKVTAMSTQDKSKREIAILKKIRHPNVVALLEIIDDPELKKIYMVLEHVELGEIVWRKKGLPHICSYERRRIEREMRGEQPTDEEQKYDIILERRQAEKDRKRAMMSQLQGGQGDYWSLEYGVPTDDDDTDSFSQSIGTFESHSYGRRMPSLPSSLVASRATSRAPSRTHSARSLSRAGGSYSNDPASVPIPDEEDMETPGPLRPNPLSSSVLDGSANGPGPEDPMLRGRSPSMADSIISHMSSIDYSRGHDPYVDDFSYVPCFTFEKARQTFRDTVLGLEYLHYQGVVHRDIKPANLLWTKDHRVKISDFGVSYFGRPVRDGEPDETISESEARDFDNDLELAKTVGTPAFFAPELCYTDSYGDKCGQPQPKVTEQIDVWSLGVTLYCIIFARIPFLAEDEWQMFKKIATEEVFIPKKRLMPVDPSTKPDEKSLYTRVNNPPYRDDDELVYEDIDPDLWDLLSKMLIKNPEKRIRLRDVKRHPWVIRGIGNVDAWLNDTDPSRKMSGRRIQVDDKEVAHAVVPLTLLERAKSAVKKAVGKVMHPRGDRAESVSSRKRATSSAASSAGDGPFGGLNTPNSRDMRRRSIRPDDYFTSLSQSNEHPLTQHITATAHDSAPDDAPAPAPQSSTSASATNYRNVFELWSDNRDEIPDRPVRALPHRTPGRHGHHHSVSNAFLSLTAAPNEVRTMPPTPMFDGPSDDPSAALRKARDMRPALDDSGRARSVDRGLFASTDKRAEPKVSLSTAIAPGNVHYSPRAAKSIDVMKTPESAVLPWTSTSASSHLTGYQHTQPKSDPNIRDKRLSHELEERPVTAHRIENTTQLNSAPVNSPPSASFSRTPPHRVRHSIYQRDESPASVKEHTVSYMAVDINPTQVPLPPSPDKDTFSDRQQPPSREDTIATTMSSSSTSLGAMTTPLTSPSETTSPHYAINPTLARDATDQMLAFQSDPSLPALLSSTSSVSADLEGEFLGNPGVVGKSVIDTTDSLTPPAFAKEPMAGFPIETQEQILQGAVQLDSRGPSLVSRRDYAHQHAHFDDGDDSDSDEGLVMAKKPKKTSSTALQPQGLMGKLAVGTAKRRDTNASVGSTDTAKKIVVDTSD